MRPIIFYEIPTRIACSTKTMEKCEAESYALDPFVLQLEDKKYERSAEISRRPEIRPFREFALNLVERLSERIKNHRNLVA